MGNFAQEIIDKMLEHADKQAEEAMEYYDTMPDVCKFRFWSSVCMGDIHGMVLRTLKEIVEDYEDEN